MAKLMEAMRDPDTWNPVDCLTPEQRAEFDRRSALLPKTSWLREIVKPSPVKPSSEAANENLVQTPTSPEDRRRVLARQGMQLMAADLRERANLRREFPLCPVTTVPAGQAESARETK